MTQGWILKKGTGKGMLQRSNWKWRWFVLESEPQLQLSYYTSQTCGKKKGGFLLRDVVQVRPSTAPLGQIEDHRQYEIEVLGTSQVFRLRAESKRR